MEGVRKIFNRNVLQRLFKAWLFVILAVFIIALVTYISEDLLLSLAKVGWESDISTNILKVAELLFWTLVLLVLVFVAAKFSGRILGLSVKDQLLVPGREDRLTNVRGMVAFLSSPWAGKAGKHEDIVQAIRDGTLSIEDIVKGNILDLEEKDEWNWQPLLTSLYVCSGGKEKLKVEILTSSAHNDPRGSDPYFCELREIVSCLLPDDVELQNSAFSLDAKSPRSVSGGLELALDMLRASGLKDREIVIELTGGPATMSAIGAIFALQDGLRAIYSANRKGEAIMPIVFTPSVTFFSDLQI